MNLMELRQKLIEAARLAPLSQRVPFGFEKRIMARLRDCRMVDAWTLWSRALWRAAAPCALIMLLLSASWWFRPAVAPPPADLSQEVYNTLLAGGESEQPLDLSR